MSKPKELLTREEALEDGVRFYGGVSEVYMQPPKGADETERSELIGTKVAMITVESDKVVLASTVEIAYSRSVRSYERHVRKAIKGAAGTIRAFNSLPLEPTSS